MEKILIKKLNPAKYNPRSISEIELTRLKNLIKEFGLVEPLVVNKDYTVIGGHQRLKVLQELNYKEADCIVVNLDKKKEKLLNLALNKISGEWDNEKLTDIFQLFDIDELNISGFDVGEINEILNFEEPAQPEFDENVETINKCPKCGYEY